MKLTLNFLLFVALVNPVFAGTITGIITSSKELKESQGAVVIWVDGLPAKETSVKPVMSQSGVQFLPHVMTVVAGQTVNFPNDDDVAHNVFSLSKAKKFKLGIYPKGETRELTFEKPGVIDLFCSIHRHMHAVIVVTPSEHASLSTLGESYTIENVPPGPRTVNIWNSAHKQVTQEVTVEENVKTILNLQLKD